MRRLRRNPELRPSPWGKNLVNRALSGRDLSHMDLSGADLTGANLEYSSVYGADLTGANLRGANLHDTDLRGANLIGADFIGANLRAARLEGARLNGANLRDAHLFNAKLTGAKLTGADLTGSDLTAVEAGGVDLERANLTAATLHSADLSRANLSGANLTGADLDNANLGGANLTGADFTGANLGWVGFTGTDLAGVDLTQALNVPRIGPLREHYEIKTPTSPAFKKWFGESVVVGDDKKPVVVYHGTLNGGFTQFDPSKRDVHHNAFYFADDINVAETYIDPREPKTRPDPAAEPGEYVGIYRLYIRLVNPMIVECQGREWKDLHDPRAPELKKTYELAKWAEAHGHDGVIFKDIVDDGGQGGDWAPLATVYAVFDPRAIKSATANNGNYDPSDPDIRRNPAVKPSSVATIIFDARGRVLILRRGPTAPWMPGKWSLPGGTVDPGEGLQQAALREAVEETTLKVKRVHPLTVIAYKPEGWSAAFFVSKPGEWSGEVELDYENDAFAWISERDISRYSFIPTVVEALHAAFKRRARDPR